MKWGKTMSYVCTNFDFKVNPDPKYTELKLNPQDFYVEPFKVIDNLYYAGTKMNGGWLIDTGEGLIMIDTGYLDLAPLLINSIWELGFNPKDIKMIFHTHKHSDHTGATKVLKGLSGAKTLMGRADGEASVARIRKQGPAITRFESDVLLDDGDEFRLGNTVIRCAHIPGHSRGCMAYLFDVHEDSKTYTVCIPGDIAINTLHKNYITQWDIYPEAQQDFLNWTEKAMNWHVDITIGPHTQTTGTLAKREYMLSHPGENPFINPDEWQEVLRGVRAQLLKNMKLEEEGRMWLDCSTPNQKLHVSDDVTDVE